MDKLSYLVGDRQAPWLLDRCQVRRYEGHDRNTFPRGRVVLLELDRRGPGDLEGAAILAPRLVEVQRFFVDAVHILSKIRPQQPLCQPPHLDVVDPHSPKPRRHHLLARLETAVGLPEDNSLVPLPPQQPILVELGQRCIAPRLSLSLEDLIGDLPSPHEDEFGRDVAGHRPPDIHEPIPKILSDERAFEGSSLRDPSSQQLPVRRSA